MGRQPCCDKVGLRRGPWTIDEDNKLICFILNNGIQCWRTVPKLAGLLRCGKSCRLRWINYLRPDLKRGDFTETEENQIIQLHSRLGNRWSKIASHFSGRTDNEIKNHWNTKLKKKLKSLGVDPLTHKPILQVHKSISANTTVVLEPVVDNLGDKASSIEECLETSEEDVKVSDGIGTICSAGVTDMLYETDSISGLILNVGFDQDTQYNNSSQDCSLWMELDALSNKTSGSVREIRSINKDSNNHCSPMLCWDSLRVQDDFFNF